MILLLPALELSISRQPHFLSIYNAVKIFSQ